MESAVLKLDVAEAFIARQDNIADLLTFQEMVDAVSKKKIRELKVAGDDSLEASNEFKHINLLAGRQIGRLTSKMEKDKGGRPSKKNADHGGQSFKKDVLAEIGLSNTAKSRNEAMASLSDAEFKGHIEETKASGGELTQAGVLKLAKKKKRNSARKEKADALRESPPLPTDKHSVIYCDPPWQYDKAVEVDNEHVYPSMSLDAICDLPVSDISADDAVMLLWATSPKLADAFVVLDAWGFEYKTSLVWDKVHMHRGGYYALVQHELLLVATRGKGIRTPKVRFMEDDAEDVREGSIYSEKRTRNSKKPDYYYGMIERMFPDESYIELFARQSRAGWNAWGNESGQGVDGE